MEILQLEKGFKADIGGRAEQQDFATGKKIPIGYVVVVCDGVGGEKGGAIASQMTVETIVQELSKLEEEDQLAIREALGRTLKIANDKVLKYAQDFGPKGMATTATITLFTSKKVYFCHVGDSRIYQIRKGKIVHRTIDHTKEQDKVRRGEQSQKIANKVKNSPLSRCIGRAGLYSTGEIDENDYKKGDRFLACTDGIYEPVPEKWLIKSVANKKKRLEEIAEDVVDYIKTNAEKPKSLDNMTMALVETAHSTDLKKTLNNSERMIKVVSFGITLGLFLAMLWLFIPPITEDIIIEQCENELKEYKEISRQFSAIDTSGLENIIDSTREKIIITYSQLDTLLDTIHFKIRPILIKPENENSRDTLLNRTLGNERIQKVYDNVSEDLSKSKKLFKKINSLNKKVGDGAN